MFKTTKVKDQYGHTVYKKTTSHNEEKQALIRTHEISFLSLHPSTKRRKRIRVRSRLHAGEPDSAEALKVSISPPLTTRIGTQISFSTEKCWLLGERSSVRFKNDAKSETWDFNLVDDEGLSVTFDKVKLAGVDTVTLKDVNGKITAEIE